MVMALNNFSASLSWLPPSYNCSLTYVVEVVDGQNVQVVPMNSTESITMNVATLNIGKTYIFMVASVDAAERMSNWSQSVLLAMQGLLWFPSHKMVYE